jgi:16S rRNA processing protein RimM
LQIMGRIAAPYGVKGWVRARAYTEAPQALLDFPGWWLIRDGEARSLALEEGGTHGDMLIAKLAGISDRSAAQQLAGADIAIPRAVFPEPAEDEYYWADLIGCKVIDVRGQPLGNVAQLIGTGANDVLVVKGERERLLPFVDQVVRGVDLESRTITVDWEADY